MLFMSFHCLYRTDRRLPSNSFVHIWAKVYSIIIKCIEAITKFRPCWSFYWKSNNEMKTLQKATSSITVHHGPVENWILINTCSRQFFKHTFCRSIIRPYYNKLMLWFVMQGRWKRNIQLKAECQYIHFYG